MCVDILLLLLWFIEQASDSGIKPESVEQKVHTEKGHKNKIKQTETIKKNHKTKVVIAIKMKQKLKTQKHFNANRFYKDFIKTCSTFS